MDGVVGPLLAATTAWHLNSILSIRSDRNSSGIVFSQCKNVGYSIIITLSSSKIKCLFSSMPRSIIVYDNRILLPP
ncbi:hypothetical protein VN97_g12824 [Penicillium thymicola]|uniref:Uncharacterized protein n=1 Tax=Penicillium thymicola TaxID=293382 RepID=A0AAI9T5C7_PENTH|nr:hypothetical protein VN97_g12824 [Penicillium thymicola]